MLLYVDIIVKKGELRAFGDFSKRLPIIPRLRFFLFLQPFQVSIYQYIVMFRYVNECFLVYFD